MPSGYDISFRTESSGGGGMTVLTNIDLTANITTALSSLDGDPGTQYGGTFAATTTTGTWDGATVDCNQFAYDGAGSAVVGAGNMSYSDITITDLYSSYDPALHGLRLICKIVDMSGNDADVDGMIGIMLPQQSAAPTNGGRGVGSVSYSGATSVRNLNRFATSSVVAGSISLESFSDPDPFCVAEFLPGKYNAHTWDRSDLGSTSAKENYARGAAEFLRILIGQNTTGSGSVSLKMRFELVIFEASDTRIDPLANLST